jgi:hypothetical protein
LQHVGVCFEHTGTLGRRRAVGFPFGRRHQVEARAVGETTCSLSAFRVIRSRRCRRGTSWRSRTAARERCRRRLSGSVDATGCSTSPPLFVRTYRSTRFVGLVSNGVVRSAGEVAAVGGVAIAPRGGSFDSPWPLRPFVLGQHPVEHLGHPVGAVNGLGVSLFMAGVSPQLASPRAAR